MTAVNPRDLAGDAVVTSFWDDLVIAPADIDRGLDGVTRSLPLAGDTRRVFGVGDLPRLKAALTKRRKAHERSGAELATALIAAERAVRDTEDDVREASHHAGELAATIEALQGRLSDVELATAALISAGEKTRVAQARLDEAEADRTGWEEERPEITRLVDDFETRLARHDNTQLPDEESLPWSESDLQRRRTSAIEASNHADGVRAEALSMLEQFRRESDAADESARQLMAKVDECRQQLQSVPCPADGPVRAAFEAYQASCASGRLDRDAGSLADRWAGVERRRNALLGSQPSPPTPETVDAARRRVDSAMARVREAELAAQDPFTPAERLELDRAHRVVSAADRPPRRWLPGQVKQRAEAQGRLDSLLGKHGFTDFLDYRIRYSQGDGSWVDALEEAHRELEQARAYAQALEEASAPSPEVRALEQERSEVRRAAVDLLGFQPGDGIEQLLRSKPQVPADLTRCLAESLRDAGVKLGDCSLEAAAHGWLAACDTQRRVRATAEKRLAVVDQQVAAIQSFAALDSSPSLLDESLQTVALLAADRAQGAGRLQELLGQELDAREEATASSERDAEDAAALRAHVEALRRHIETTERQMKHGSSVAAKALCAAVAERERATESLDASRRDLALFLGSDTLLDSVLSAGLAELNELLGRSETAHGGLVTALATRQRAYGERADVHLNVGRHGAAAPPVLPALPGPVDVVAALEWLARGKGNAQGPLAVYVCQERADELLPDDSRQVLELSRHHWVVCASETRDGDAISSSDVPSLVDLRGDLSFSDAGSSATRRRGPLVRRLRQRSRSQRP